MIEVKTFPIALVDIDRTLADDYWRDHLLAMDFDLYHEASIDDQPILEMCRIIRAMKNNGWTMIGLTARPERYRPLTMKWLLKNGIDLDELIMRPHGDFRPSPELKVALAQERFQNIVEEVAMVFEDRDDVCLAFRTLGLTVLQVHARRNPEVKQPQEKAI